MSDADDEILKLDLTEWDGTVPESDEWPDEWRIERQAEADAKDLARPEDDAEYANAAAAATPATSIDAEVNSPDESYRDGPGSDVRIPEGFDDWSSHLRHDWAHPFENLGHHVERRRKEIYAEWNRAHPGVDDGGLYACDSGVDRAKPSRTPFTILSRDEVRSMPRIEWFVKNVLQTSGIIVIGGDGSVGKTAVAIDLMGCITTGRTWYGRTVIQVRCLYVIGEGVEGVEDRLIAWEGKSGVKIPDDLIDFVAEKFKLNNDAVVDYAIQMVKENDYGVVFLDTLSQLGGLDNENDNSEMSKALERAVAIRQARPGTSVVILHHTSKGGRLRGASALRDNVDAVIMAVGQPGGGFNLTTEGEHDGKQKNGKQETLTGFWLDVVPVGTDDDGSVRESIVVRKGGRNPMVASILSLMADGQEHSGIETYLAAVGLTATDSEKKKVRRVLADLVVDGTLVSNGLKTIAARWHLGQPNP